jgi:uncharacterized protein (DUF58 family)
MMIGPLIYNVRSVLLALRHIRIERTLPESVTAGDLFAVTLLLSNEKPKTASWAIEVEDDVQRLDGSRADRNQGRVLFPHVPAGKSQRQHYHGRLMRRGRYQFGPLKVSTRFPFGLVRRTWTFSARDTLTVFPRPGRLTEAWRRRRRPQLSGSARSRHQQGPLEGEFFALRDWQPGDSRRWIHWRSSARHGNLLVRQFEQQQDEDLVLLLDLWQPKSPSDADREHVERGVRFAATLASDLCRRGGARIDFAVSGKSVQQIHGVASPGLLNEILGTLAVLEAGQQDPSGEFLNQGLRHAALGSTIVLISTRKLDLASAGLRKGISDETARRLFSQHLVQVHCGEEELLEYCVLDY